MRSSGSRGHATRPAVLPTSYLTSDEQLTTSWSLIRLASRSADLSCTRDMPPAAIRFRTRKERAQSSSRVRLVTGPPSSRKHQRQGVARSP